MSKVEHARYYFIILIGVAISYTIAHFWIIGGEIPWRTPLLLVFAVTNALLWRSITVWMARKSGAASLGPRSVVAGAVGLYALSMMYIPPQGSLVLGGLARLYIMLFLVLSGYVASYAMYSSLRRIFPEGVSSALPSAVMAASATFLLVLYALNIFSNDILGTYVTYDMAVMALNQVNVGGFILRSMGPFYLMASISIFSTALLVFFGLYILVRNGLRSMDAKNCGWVRLWIVAAMVIPSILLTPYSTEVTGSEPLVILAKSAYDSWENAPGHSNALRGMPLIGARRSVLLIQADSLRAGSMGVYGYGRNTTPNMDRLAARGLVVDRFYSPLGISEYAMTSIVTGIDPCRRKTGYPSLFEAMKHNGYRTALFSSGDNRWGNMDETIFASGVDSYFDYGTYSGGEARSWNRIGGNMIDDAETAAKAIEWLRGLDGSDDFFLYFNPQSAHTTYNFNRSGSGLYSPYHYGSDVTGLVEAIRERRPSATNTYDNSVRYLDEQVGYVLEALDELNRSGSTVIILVSDHGEELMEHGRIGHGTSAYDEQSRVPFIIHYPEANGTSHTGLGQHVDVMPTLMGALGVELMPGYDGVNLLAKNRTRAYFCGQDEGVVRGGYKYLRSRVGGRERLFNLADDPSESRNLAESRADLLEEMRAEYEAYAAA